MSQKDGEYRQITMTGTNKGQIDFHSLGIVSLMADIMQILGDLESQSENFVGAYFEWMRQHEMFACEQEPERVTLVRAREIVGELETKTRKLRDYVSRLNADLIYHGLDDGKYDVSRLGFEGYVGHDAIELSIPFYWAYFSSRFLFQPMNSAHWRNLRTNVDVWHYVMTLALNKMAPYYPFERPMRKAKVTIRVFFPTKRFGDPDHFWFRPVLDSLVQNAWICNDSAGSIRVETRYYFSRENPEIRIMVQNYKGTWDDEDLKISLNRVF
jgi:hypothetical protein